MAHNASPFNNRGISPVSPAASRMKRFFKGGARSTRPRPMSRNERILDLSREFELSPSRISQIRREFWLDWHRFLGDLDLA